MIHIISDLIKQYQTSNHRHDCQINMIQSISISSGWFLATWTPSLCHQRIPKFQTGNPQRWSLHHQIASSWLPGDLKKWEASTVNIFPVFFPNKNISSLRHQLQLQGKVPHLRPLRRKTPCWVKEQCLTLRSMSFGEGLEDDSARSPLGSVWSRSLEETLPRRLFDKRFAGKYFQILS